MKILGVVTILFAGAVYWAIGAFLNLMLYIWPIPVQKPPEPAPAASVQGYIRQATPGYLQPAADVQ